MTYCVICISSLFGILTDELKAGVVDYVLSCQTYEGGFGGEPGNEAHGGLAFCSLATLYILEALDQIRDLPGLLHWLANRQMPFEGGYQGRTNKLVDGCYSFWQGAVPALLADVVRQKYGEDVPYQCHQEQLQSTSCFADRRFQVDCVTSPESLATIITRAIASVVCR